jgi:hypothetical protein
VTDCYTYRRRHCQWLKTRQLQCKETRKEDVKWCEQEEDQGYEECTESRDQGYNDCSDWVKNCCTWWPCNKICESFEWVCRAWTWIKNIVCIATTWIQKIVCLSWAYFSVFVCNLWVLIEEWRCVLAWISYVICRAPLAIRNLGIRIRAWWINYLDCLDPADMPPNPLEKEGWILTFQDDFPGAVVDPAKWEDGPWWKERYFRDPAKVPKIYFTIDNYLLSGGILRLIADDTATPVNDPLYGGDISIPYSVAWLEWPKAVDQLRGYFEIRCRIPSTPDMWPAFWLASRDAEVVEIDIFEFYTSNTNSFNSNIHWGTKETHQDKVKSHPVCQAADYFHIYACEWSQTEVRWYYDNTLIRVETNGLSEFLHPMLVIINSSVDARAGHHPEHSTYPNYFEIDYVRAYRR